MARAIVRYSFETEDKGERQQIRDQLSAAGFRRVGREAAAFEKQGSRSELIAALTGG